MGTVSFSCTDTAKQIRLHLESHSGINPFKCQVCKSYESFDVDKILYKHFYMKHGRAGIEDKDVVTDDAKLAKMQKVVNADILTIYAQQTRGHGVSKSNSTIGNRMEQIAKNTQAQTAHKEIEEVMNVINK